MTAPEPAAGLVLAGGQGRRFGGLDKGLQPYRGKPLAQHALLHLDGCAQRLISANRNQDSYRALGAQVVGDRRADYQGPLSGIESAMAVAATHWLYVVPCDVLGMPADWLAQLRAHAAATGSPWVGTVDGDRLQPLLGLWSLQLLPLLSEYLDGGGRRVMEFVAPWRGHALALPSGYRLHNLNTPQALREA